MTAQRAELLGRCVSLDPLGWQPVHDIIRSERSAAAAAAECGLLLFSGSDVHQLSRLDFSPFFLSDVPVRLERVSFCFVFREVNRNAPSSHWAELFNVKFPFSLPPRADHTLLKQLVASCCFLLPLLCISLLLCIWYMNSHRASNTKCWFAGIYVFGAKFYIYIYVYMFCKMVKVHHLEHIYETCLLSCMCQGCE